MNADQKKMYKMHYKSRIFMISSITFKEFDKCSNKEATNSIYDSLILTHEGSKQVQEAKNNLLVKKYELLKMEEDEDNETMFFGFQILVSGLKVLEKSYTTSDHVKKIIRSLTSKWRPKITAILKEKDLNTLKLDELFSSLISMKLSLKKTSPRRRKDFGLEIQVV
ncbi:uncharacterized protein [Cicer arietinum]|uniref:uncharacterized protein n=1 Tax=Cicer arietinum TaxID=3827 RepID=UPI003CC6C0D2